MFSKEKKREPEKPIVREGDMRISAETIRFVVEQSESNGYDVAAILGRIILGAFQSPPPDRPLDRAIELMQRAQDELRGSTGEH
jgi:hypothetical protein